VMKSRSLALLAEHNASRQGKLEPLIRITGMSPLLFLTDYVFGGSKRINPRLFS
jgi:hypothetical protein